MDLYEFDSFRFDARTRLLLKDGREIPLARTTAELLLLLVKRPGQVILREELQSGLWGDRFIEADNNLAFNIHRLREALGRRDDGQSYIETLPKRGYRFVAAINKIQSEQVSSYVPVPRTQGSAAEESRELGPESVPKAQPHFLPARRLAGFVLVGAIVLLGLAVGVFELRLTSNPRLTVASYSQLTNDGHDKGGVLLTDGARIYFQERVSTGQQLAWVAVEGGPIGTLPVSLQGTSIFDISPFRSEILAGRTSSNDDPPELWIMSLLGSPVRRVGTLRGDSAIWSPARTRIASILGTSLFISSSDGTGTRKIANIPTGSSWLRWSPDEKRLRFSTIEYRIGNTQRSLWEVNVDGTSLHRLLAGWNSVPGECCGSWTPDGSFYVFESFRNGHTDLWAIPERQTLFGRQSSVPIRLYSGPIDFYGLAIGRDGKLFATGMHERGELVSYKPDLHDFVKFLGGISAIWVSFARSGQWVAYIDYPSLTIWRAKADGSEKTQITFSPLQVDGFSWSPDEKWFAIRARNPGSLWRIYLIPSRGGKPEPLMAGETEQGVPTWSSDGSRLCFGDVPAVFGKPSGAEMIHIFDLRTHKLSDLPGSRGLWTSRWSTDGRFVSALTIEGEKLKLFDFSTNTWRSTNAVHVNNPNWTTDSKFIYYDTEANDRMLQRVCIRDGKVEQLANLRDYPGVAAWWSGLSPNNEPLLMRNLGSTEIYLLALEYK